VSKIYFFFNGLTTAPSAVVKPVHPKAMQVIQTTGLHEEPCSTGSAEIERLLTKINTRVGFDALKIVRVDLWVEGHRPPASLFPRARDVAAKPEKRTSGFASASKQHHQSISSPSSRR
jgi:hypothetical protein